MGEVVSIYPANDFKVVAENASEAIECGIIIGYDSNGELAVFGGGMIDGKQPTAKDWLFMVATFQQKLINGDYYDG